MALSLAETGAEVEELEEKVEERKNKQNLIEGQGNSNVVEWSKRLLLKEEAKHVDNR